MSEDKNRLISFTDNYSDESSKSGFKFTFYCDHCGEGYKTRFIESKTSKKKGLFKGIGKLASVFGRLAGQRNVGYSIDEGTDVLSNK